MAKATSKSSGDSTQLLLLSLPPATAGQAPRPTGPLGSHYSPATILHPFRAANSMPHSDHPPRFPTKRVPVPDSILQLSSWANSTGHLTTVAARDPGTCSFVLLGAELIRAAKAPPSLELSSNCNSQRRLAMGKGATERGRSVIGGALSVLLIGTRRRLREVLLH